MSPWWEFPLNATQTKQDKCFWLPCCILKNLLYSIHNRQYFCTVSHQSSRIGSALLLHQTFLNRGKATPHGPTNVYKLKWLRVLCSTWVTVTCCAVLRTFYFSVLLFPMSYSIPQNHPNGFMCLCFHLEFDSGFLFWSGSKCGRQRLSTHRTTIDGQRANCRPRNIV